MKRKPTEKDSPSRPVARSLASFWRQIIIIQKKNLLLYKNNKIGILCEILFPCIFIALLYLVVSSLADGNQTLYTSPFINKMKLRQPEYINTIYFYPNNDFVKELITNSLDSNNQFVSIIGVNSSEPKNFTVKYTNFMFVSFPTNYSSLESLPNKIEYKIHTNK
jgi:hypothetical protein